MSIIETIDERRDAVTLYLHGLGIICFNDTLGRCEIALLRHEDHILTIKVIKIEKGTEHTIAAFSPGNNDTQIEIYGETNPQNPGFSRYQPGGFNRVAGMDANDKFDLRWIPDIEGGEFHNKKLEATKMAMEEYGMPLTPLYIKNAEIYSKQCTPYINERVVMQSGVESSSEFGHAGYKLGAKIEANKVILRITENGVDQEVAMSKAPGVFFRVEIDNVRPGGDTGSDFPIYYRVLNDPSGDKYDLVRVAASAPEDENNYCGEIIAGLTSSISEYS